MVNLNVPEELLEFLKSFERPVRPCHLLNALTWLSNNPERAKSIAKKLRKLNYAGRKTFERNISWGVDIREALSRAEKAHEESRKQRSLLSKFLTAVRGGRFEGEMPNGVRYYAVFSGGHYVFTFMPKGAEISLVIRKKRGCLALFLDGLSSGRVVGGLAWAVIYNGRKYPPSSRIGSVLLEAIAENADPGVIAVVDPTDQ